MISRISLAEKTNKIPRIHRAQSNSVSPVDARSQQPVHQVTPAPAQTSECPRVCQSQPSHRVHMSRAHLTRSLSHRVHEHAVQRERDHGGRGADAASRKSGATSR